MRGRRASTVRDNLFTSVSGRCSSILRRRPSLELIGPFDHPLRRRARGALRAAVRDHISPRFARIRRMETATQALHRLTSTSRAVSGRIRSTTRGWCRTSRSTTSTAPVFYKRYARPPLASTCRATCLRRASRPSRSSRARPRSIAPRSTCTASRLLHLAAGVVRTSARPDGTWLFRAAGSAGGRFPLSSTSPCPRVAAVPAGVHWYHPEEHALLQVGPPPTRRGPGARRDRRALADGLALPRARLPPRVLGRGNDALAGARAADSAGLAAAAVTRFPDAAWRPRRRRRRSRWPVAVVALGEGARADRTGPGGAGDADSAAAEFPLVTAAQRAGDGEALGPPWVPARRPRRCRGTARSRRWSSAQLAAADGPDRTVPAACCARLAWRCAESQCRTSSLCTTWTACRAGSTAGRPHYAGRPPDAARGAATGRAGAGSGRDAAFVVMARDRPGGARRPRRTARRSSPPGSSRAGSTSWPTASARRLRDDVPRQRSPALLGEPSTRCSSPASACRSTRRRGGPPARRRRSGR